MMQWNEAQTRCLIDEQLRKAGWEADTINLRYSKGTRPVKGRNIAISEWPTNSAFYKMDMQTMPSSLGKNSSL